MAGNILQRADNSQDEVQRSFSFATDVTDIADQMTNQYMHYICSYSGPKPKNRTLRLWDIVRPHEYERMIPELGGILKVLKS
eukprot:SAG11_NODE_34254_length_273_cov_0.586207_1_plen_82_part_10